MDRIERIKKKLEVLQPQYLNIIDQTAAHIGHLEDNNSLQTHLKLTIFAKTLEDIPKVEQHRTINNLVLHEFDQGLHALSINILKEPYN